MMLILLADDNLSIKNFIFLVPYFILSINLIMGHTVSHFDKYLNIFVVMLLFLECSY